MTPPAAQRAGSKNRHRVAAGRLASLFDEHASMVLGLCRLLLRDHHEAEDAAQQTFVSAYRSLLRGTEPRDAAPWLAAIARNECRARIRKRMRAPLALEYELEEQLAHPGDIADESERRAELAALTKAIAELPSRQREAVALRDFLGLSYEEVASTLSVSVPVVESLLFRARRRLRDTIRTVPRYAAGLVAIPFALRAAVSRELPDLDSQTPAGAAGIAGAAAAGVLAKIVSLPFAGKAATAVTVVAVATAGPQIPQLLDRDKGASRSAVSALHDSPGVSAATADEPRPTPSPDAEPKPAEQPKPPADEPVETAPPVTSSAPAAVEADSEEPAPAEGKPADEQPATEPSEEQPAEPEEVREVVKAEPVVLQGALLLPPPSVEPAPTPAPAPEQQPQPAPATTTPAAPPADPPLVLGTGTGAQAPPPETPATTEPPAPAQTAPPEPAPPETPAEPAAPEPSAEGTPAETPEAPAP
jgi:RNA polymerase sigma-70 factor (ECF subfamily)